MKTMIAVFGLSVMAVVPTHASADCAPYEAGHRKQLARYYETNEGCECDDQCSCTCPNGVTLGTVTAGESTNYCKYDVAAFDIADNFLFVYKVQCSKTMFPVCEER